MTNVEKSFPEWYWKRFIRIYIPYLICLPFLFFAGDLQGWDMLNIMLPFDAYHFIPSILFLYIPYYFASRLNQTTKVTYPYIIALVTAIALGYYFFFYDYENGYILQHFTLIETISYFIPMLLGAMAKEGKWLKNKTVSFGVVIVTFILYVYQSFWPFTGILKILQLCIGLFFAYGLGSFLLNIQEKLPKIKIVELTATVTLEAYLVQFISRFAFKAVGFPTNIVYHVICVISVAYCLHWVSDAIVRYMAKIPVKRQKCH